MEPAQIMAAGWGWTRPSDDIIRLANIAQTTSGKPELGLSELKLLEPQQIEVLRRKHPGSKDLLDLAAQEYPAKVQPFLEMINALSNGFPFYDQLEILEPHPTINEAAVAKRCEELDCALLLIESQQPVIVFSTFKAMMSYSTAGRAAKANDPLLVKTGDASPKFAVGSRDDISAIIAQARGHQDEAAGESVNVWHATSPETKEHPAQRELARLFDHAIAEGATDVALIPQLDGSYHVLIRKYGKLIAPRTGARWLPQLANSIIEVLQNKSGANPSNTAYKTPRDGHISYKSGVGDAFMRASFVPLNHLGELKTRPSVSVRLFSHSESTINLEALGLQPEVLAAIDDAVRMPQGQILVAGPMNSGKSSTIAGALGLHARIYGRSRKRVSVEEPIERFIADVTQINVPPIALKQGGVRVADEQRFNEILRGLKRHDVNTFWIGEVRDQETAEFCATVSASGHLLLTTIHAKDSILAFDILAKMVRADMRFQLAESMALIISQRLVPSLCTVCHRKSAPTDTEVAQWARYMSILGEKLALPPVLSYARPHEDTQCPHCEDGYAGLVPVSEVLPFTRSVRDAALILLEAEGDKKAARLAIAKERTLTLVGSAHRYLAAGAVDLASVIYL
ncbi:GspE/PulE family protein [Xanthomonas arboricola]|uniref:GspE/PulE family protein n=1 Tax=Xanthomonas arboricola TaxID=56448 RepID=UPI00069CC51C|nr:ATPase, T2SS/T4P/T4SS family [Xanthomonas arboricola]KOB43469.1 hypothetical protein AE931_12975 [Xanthomonas arboricola]